MNSSVSKQHKCDTASISFLAPGLYFIVVNGEIFASWVYDATVSKSVAFGVASDPTCWILTTFPHPGQPNWSVSVPVTGSSHDNGRLSQCPGPLHVLSYLLCSFLTQNPGWPHSRAAQNHPSCWPTSKLHSSQTCRPSPPLILSACSIITAGPLLIQPPPIGSQLLATWPTFLIANC